MRKTNKNKIEKVIVLVMLMMFSISFASADLDYSTGEAVYGTLADGTPDYGGSLVTYDGINFTYSNIGILAYIKPRINPSSYESELLFGLSSDILKIQSTGVYIGGNLNVSNGINVTGGLNVNSGNVGIGTTSPDQKLHVEGTIVSGTTTDGIALWRSGTIGEVLGINSGFTGYNDIGIRAQTGTQLYLKTDGNVGIGTTVPSSELVINSASPELKLSANDVVGMILKNDGTNQVITAAVGSLNFAVSTVAKDISFVAPRKITFGASGDEKMRIDSSGNVGIGTTTPTLAILQVNGSVSGISIYAENNISAEDYLYHSPFPDESYTKEQALSDLIKIKGNNGKINHSSLPLNTVSIIEKPIYSITEIQTERIESTPIKENYTYTEQICGYKASKLDSKKYDYLCEDVVKTAEKNKQICHDETKIKYEKPITTTEECDEIFNEEKNKTEEVCSDKSVKKDYFEKIEYTEHVCVDVLENKTIIENSTNQTQIGTEEEPQTSVGMMIGNIVLSIKRLFEWNTAQDSRLLKMEETLCSDGHLEYCKIEVIE